MAQCKSCLSQTAPWSPRLGDAATSALRKEIQREGTFRLANDEYTDLIVTGEIRQYTRGEVTFLPTDVVTARDYQVSMRAHVVARERITGKVVLERDLSGTALMRVGSDLPSAERQTLPLLATDLARQITAALADGTW
ncbi:MAG: LPS assembly lipoprotein LptE [Verrucomicrobiota bacterium]